MLSYLDWSIILAYLLLSLLIGLYYTKQAEKSTQDYFLGGRQISWWLAGLSMVATTFAADTPLLITEIVAMQGISGNWLWWNGLIGGMVATFFFAKYWHKANILTDVELTELRYAGKEAGFLRGFKAIYLGVFMNGVIIAWVNVALGSILHIFLGIPKEELLYYYMFAMGFVVVYTSLSGLTGVAVTDAIQFVLAMTGCIILAYLVIASPKIGGLQGLVQKLPAETLEFFPRFSSGEAVGKGVQALGISVATFFSFVAVQWWASWYPGAEPGGGGYVAQRMMSTPKPQDAVKATLLFQLAHHALRPWAWILVGLAAIVLYPELSAEDKKLGYVMAMKEFLPDGLRGMLIVAFLAAYMSTIATQFNWGGSYVINDFYQRFVNPTASQKQLVNASKITTVLLMLVGLVITSFLSTLEGAFQFMISASAGLGGVLILRWYWWRINVWSEITATVAPFVFLPLVMPIYTDKILKTSYYLYGFHLNLPEPYGFFFIVACTTISWVVVTFLTPPTDSQTLINFVQKINPTIGWKPIYQKMTLENNTTKHIPASNLGILLLAVLSGMCLIYGLLFLTGALLLGKTWWVFATIFGLGLVGMNFVLKKME
jgi:Na+/proline symporter